MKDLPNYFVHLLMQSQQLNGACRHVTCYEMVVQIGILICEDVLEILFH